MIIDSIQNGIVIDHITAGKSMELYQILGLDQFTYFPNLFRTFFHILLTAKSRLYSHDQNHIHIAEHMTYIVYRCSRFDGNSHLHTCFPDLFNSSLKIFTCLRMYCNGICPTFHKISDISLRLCNHEMYIKKQL